MSEFKFACPVCGQHIKCESEEAGTQLECPTCYQKVIVPQAPADGSKFVLTASQPQARPLPHAGAPVGTPSQAAPASGLPTAAAVALVLLCAIAGIFVAFRGKIFKPAPRLAANTSATSSVTNAAAGQPGSGSNATAAAIDDPWTLDLTNTILPGAVAAGRIRGTNFTCDLAVLQGGTLILRAGTIGLPYVGLTIDFTVRRSEDLAGLQVNITTNAPFVPRVVLRSVDNELPVTEIIRGGYAMKLNFGRVAGGRIPGRIYICLPDEAKSYVAGSFQAEIRVLAAPPKPRPQTPTPRRR